MDAVVDPRSMSTATTIAADRLIAAGFTPYPTDAATVYRFIRGDDIVDVLAPDNLGERASLITVPPAETIGAPGGNAALRRRRVAIVDAGFGRFDVPLPNLVGAIIIKARAAAMAIVDRDKHERDLARLLTLVTDPESAWRELSPKERGHLRTELALADPRHTAWARVPGTLDGVLALEIMAAVTLD